MFEIGDACLILGGLLILEERVQAFEDGGLPVSEKLRFDVVLAAELGLAGSAAQQIEHHLGLTCEPVAGLVQIPCIERNALAGVKAINAARMALAGDGTHHVSLDAAIRTMRETGADMHHKYKETSTGGLALNVVAC